MADNRLTPEQQLANELELKYWDKRETFWQRMFIGCSGFVAVVTPLSLQVSISDTARHCLFGAVIAAAICAVLLAVLLHRSTRWMHELQEKAKEVARGKCDASEYTPPALTEFEKLAAWGAAVAIVLALVCMVGVIIACW